ncbi:MAG: helix-turn-helix domain-containing protein [Lentisphaerota bacterium]
MLLSNKITPELLAGATGLIRPFCPELTATNLVEAIKNHRSEQSQKPQGLQKSLTYKEFAALAGLSLPTVHRLAKSRALKTVKVGPRLVRIPAVEVERILTEGTK